MPTMSEIKNDIEYVIFAQHEYPMERYVELQGIIEGLVQLVSIHCDAAVSHALLEAKYAIAKNLKDTINQTVLDYTVVAPTHVLLDEPFESPKPVSALDTLLEIDI